MPKVTTKHRGRPRVHLSLASFRRHKAKELLPVHDLCEELGYGLTNKRRYINFYNTVANYGAGFKSRSTVAGIRALHWCNSAHKQLILEMARDFLETDKNGELFWPDDSMQANHGRLPYSKDYGLIQETMLVLFFQTLMNPPDDRATILAEIPAEDANTPGSGYDQVSHPVPADVHHPSVEEFRFPGEGAVDGPTNRDDSLLNTTSDDEGTEPQPGLRQPSDAAFPPRNPTIEDMIDESLSSHPPHNRIPSPDQLAHTAKATGGFERALSRDLEPTQSSSSLKTDIVVSFFNPSGINRPWMPRTGISSMSLQRLFDELPVRCRFTGLIIRLHVAENSYEYRLYAGDNDVFEQMLIRYSDKIGDFKREHRHEKRQVVFDMCISPVYDENAQWIDGG
ncbi:hypothetical protein B0J13DRAFT_625485 [Dactylonectria estremocensis]|uniref:Uncharacterized protein n=1 Tax=Dactylonectria estremocensis TaxID=1079267 RepID=A0A9P9EFT7_9HYPO|nr:hypothetical protein B0J13DRAFT_625485 [Dactylonectria estremocensis]